MGIPELQRQCCVGGCARDATRLKRTLCEAHYYQQRRGRPFTAITERVDGSDCQIEGCDKRRGRSRYCSMHRARIDRHGDPNAFTPQSERNLPRGEDHHGWVSDPDYRQWHQRLRKVKGSARLHICECGQQARHWAYRGPRLPGELQPYRTDPALYEAMCVSCHKTKDMAAIRSIAPVGA